MPNLLSGPARAFPASTTRRALGALTILACAACAPDPQGGAASSPLPVGTAYTGLLPRMLGAETARDTVGSFLVLVEKDTTRLPAFHVPFGWTKIHLSFTTSDNRVNVSLTDNGSALTIATKTSTECSSFSRYHQYGARGGHRHLHGDMADALRIALEGCPRGMEAAGEYLREFQQAESDFPAALQAMMARVDVIFGGRLARCENPADPHDRMAWSRLNERCGAV